MPNQPETNPLKRKKSSSSSAAKKPKSNESMEDLNQKFNDLISKLSNAESSNLHYSSILIEIINNRCSLGDNKTIGKEEAKKSYLQAIEYINKYQLNSEKEREAHIFFNIGCISESQNQFESAISYFEKALAIYQKLFDESAQKKYGKYIKTTSNQIGNLQEKAKSPFATESNIQTSTNSNSNLSTIATAYLSEEEMELEEVLADQDDLLKGMKVGGFTIYERDVEGPKSDDYFQKNVEIGSLY